MTSFSRITDKLFTKLQHEDSITSDVPRDRFAIANEQKEWDLSSLNPRLDLFFKRLVLKYPSFSFSISILRELILTIAQPQIISEILVDQGKICFGSNEAQIPSAIIREVRRVELTLSQMMRVEEKGDSPAPCHEFFDLTIDHALQRWIPKSSSYLALKKDIQSNGLKNPIRYWTHQGKRIIIDGCDRYLICLELGIAIRAIEEFYADIREATNARIDAHLMTRQLTTNALNYLIGARYVRDSSCNEGNLRNIAVEMGLLYSKNECTIRNHGIFYRAVEYICHNVEPSRAQEFKDKLFANEIKFSLNNLKQVFKLEPGSINNAVTVGIEMGKLPSIPEFEIGKKVKLLPQKGNRTLDEHVEKVGKYMGLGASGKPTVEVDGSMTIASVEEIEDLDTWSARTKRNLRVVKTPEVVKPNKSKVVEISQGRDRVDCLLEELKTLVAIASLSMVQVVKLEELVSQAKRASQRKLESPLKQIYE